MAIKNRMIKKGDVIIFISLCLLCAFLFVLPLFGGDRKTAVITLDGETAAEIDLSAVPEAYTLQVGSCIIRVDKDSVRFENSDCPDKLCMKSGKLSKAGDTAACVPNRVVATIKGEKKKDADMVAY